MEKMYNTFEAAKLLGMKVRTIRAWIYEKKIRATKYAGGTKWYISASEIERIAKGEPINDNED